MTNRCTVPEEFLILSDSISLSQPQQRRTVSTRLFTLHVFFSQTQFQEIINWIQDLEFRILILTIRRPVTVLNPLAEHDSWILSLTKERPASVLNLLTEHDFRVLSLTIRRPASVLNPFTELDFRILSLTIRRPVSVLNPFMRIDSLPSVSARDSLSSESAKDINDESDWVKANSLFTFNSSNDIQLWIMKVNDYVIDEVWLRGPSWSS